MKKSLGIVFTFTCLLLFATAFAVTDAPTATADTAESAETPAVSEADRVIEAESRGLELLPPEGEAQSDWRCKNVSNGDDIQCECNNFHLGTGGTSCLATKDGFEVRTLDGCDAIAKCADGTSYNCSGSSVCQARIETDTGDGWIDCDGSRTNFTC